MIFENSPFEWQAPPRGLMFWPLVILRGLGLVMLTFGLIIPFCLVRYGQKLFGLTHCEYAIYRLWGKLSWYAFSIKPVVHGKPLNRGGAIVANHVSWLDVPVLFGTIGGYMVAKEEVSEMLVIGQFASILGTEFVDRKRASSRKQADSLQARLKADDRLIFFPEGTSTDGLQCTPFRSTLFAALVEANPEGLVQPVSIVYRAPAGASVNFYGWWALMPLGAHMLAMLGMPKRGHVDVVFHEPIKIGTDRKALCKTCQAAVEAGFREFLKIPQAQ